MAAESKFETAITLFADVRTRFDQLGTNLWPANDHDLEQHLAAAREQLDEATFTTAWEQGLTMPFAQALTKIK